MSKFRIRILIWGTLLILSILVVIVLHVQLESKVEIRNGFLYNLLNGALTFWIIFILLSIVLLDLLMDDSTTSRIKRYFLTPLIFVIFIVSIFMTFSSPNLKKDAIVYENRVDSREKIICEFWESGIGGNGNWRIIKTSSKNFILRPIQVISDTALRNELVLGEYPSEFEPKSIFKFQNNTFELNR